MPSSPPPDRFQREIDDIIRLAERRLEHQSFSYRMRRSTRRLGGVMGGFGGFRLPPAETLGGWGLICLLVAAVLSLPFLRFVPFRETLWSLAILVGFVLLITALVTSLLRGRGGGGGGEKMWRGERVYYGSPYGEGFLGRLRRIFRGRR